MRIGFPLSEKSIIILSFGAIYFIWGSTYLASFWAFTAFPPLFISALRFAAAGIILLSFSSSGLKNITFAQTRNSALFGVLILGIGSGAGMWSVQYIPTGITALIVGCMPLLMVILSGVLFSTPITWPRWLGVGLGIAGLVLLVSQREITTQPGAYKGFISISMAVLAWAFGSLYLGRSNLPKSKRTNASIQMLAGGLFLGLVSWIAGEDLTHISQDFNQKAALSWVYLVFFGSLIAYSAFNYLLLKVEPTKVSTATFVNPVVAMFLGWGLNSEELSLQSGIAAMIVLSGVVFITRGKSQAVNSKDVKQSTLADSAVD
jgi:drug/metabolite transporter (DMT)-like permease